MADPKDDKTRVIPRSDPHNQETTIMPNRGGPAFPPGSGGLAMPGGQRGTVIGQVDIQGQVRTPGQGGAAAGGPALAARSPAQGETIFVPAQPTGVEPGAPPFDPVVGWLVVVKGPGRGQFKPVYYGQNSIGRDEKQRVRLDYGDQRISRDTHAFIVYDDEGRRFFVRDNGKSNLLRLRGNLVMTPTELMDRDEITVGDTTLLFVALCNVGFDWLANHEPAKT